MDAKLTATVFDGRKAHAVTAFKGQRFSLVFFCSQSTDASEALKLELQTLGFQVPDKASLRGSHVYSAGLDLNRCNLNV